MTSAPTSLARERRGDRPRPRREPAPGEIASASNSLAVAVQGSAFRRAMGFAAMLLGMFMAILDIQIVASSLPEIQAGLAAGADEISWVQTSYLIGEVIMIALSGYLSRLLSLRVLFVLSAAGFTAMSIACASASSLTAMILWRGLQGFLGGAMIPTVFAASFTFFPATKQRAVSVAMALVATTGPTLGPTLGGYLTEAFSWHSLFLINLPPGVLVAGCVWLLVDGDRPDRSLLKSFDCVGLVLMALFLGSLVYVLEEGPRHEWLADATIRRAVILMAASGLLFFWRALSCRNPIVDLRAFANRNFAVGSLFSFLLGIGLYGPIYILPVYLARIRGYDSLQIGQLMFVGGAFQFLAAPLVAAMSRRLDLRVMLGLGFALLGAGLFLMTSLTAQWGFWQFFAPQGLRGVALMLCFLPINTLALGTLPPDRLKNASGLYNLMRNLGGAIGLAAINTVISERLPLHWSRLADHINAARPSVRLYLEAMSEKFVAIVAGDPRTAALQHAARLVMREALVMTLNDCLFLMAAVFGAALLLLPLVRRPKNGVVAGE